MVDLPSFCCFSAHQSGGTLDPHNLGGGNVFGHNFRSFPRTRAYTILQHAYHRP